VSIHYPPIHRVSLKIHDETSLLLHLLLDLVGGCIFGILDFWWISLSDRVRRRDVHYWCLLFELIITELVHTFCMVLAFCINSTRGRGAL